MKLHRLVDIREINAHLTRTIYHNPMSWQLLDRKLVDVLQPSSGSSERRSGAPDNDKPLCCNQCQYHITTTDARIERGGQHEHQFMNPGLLIYCIGCFSQAPGVRRLGEASVQWSWFPGYSWQIACCSNCGVHLGWLFLSDDDGFAGLILEKLSKFLP